MAKSKQTGRKALPAMGAEPALSAKVGGVSNTTVNPSAKKSGPTMSFAKGGSVMGGFRNAAMEHKR